MFFLPSDAKFIGEVYMRLINKHRFILTKVLFIVFFAGFFANMQLKITAQEQLDTKSIDAEYDSDELLEFRISVNVDIVSLYASVVDKKNLFVSGLVQNQFRLLENGVEQKIEYFTQEDVPISMGLVLDLSNSMSGIVKQVNQSVLAFLEAGKPSDEFFLVGFGENVYVLHEYTSNIDKIRDALDHIQLTSGTHLYDAIYLSVGKAHAGSMPKKALVVITDGADRGSYYNLKALTAAIQESEVQVYCIGIDSGGYSGISTDVLKRISDETGGKAFFLRNMSALPGIVDEIAKDLRGQYGIGYSSSNTERNDMYRTIKIELTGKETNGMKVRHRSGYIAREKQR